MWTPKWNFHFLALTVCFTLLSIPQSPVNHIEITEDLKSGCEWCDGVCYIVALWSSPRSRSVVFTPSWTTRDPTFCLSLSLSVSVISASTSFFHSSFYTPSAPLSWHDRTFPQLSHVSLPVCLSLGFNLSFWQSPPHMIHTHTLISSSHLLYSDIQADLLAYFAYFSL